MAKAEELNLDHVENRGRSGASSWLCLCCSSCGPGNAEAGLNLTGSHGYRHAHVLHPGASTSHPLTPISLTICPQLDLDLPVSSG